MAAVFFIASYDVIDAERYESEYVPAVVAALARVNGETLVATGSAERLDGEPAAHTVVFRFPSRAAFDQWYGGAEGGSLGRLREATTTNATAVLARGFGGESSSAGDR